MPQNDYESTDKSYAIQIDNLSKTYKNIEAVKGLSLKVPHGCFFALLGPNGSGKTSTLRTLATLTSADSGSVIINGIDACKNPREVRKHIGFVGQEISLDKILTGEEHLRFTSDLHHLSRHQRKQRIETVIEQLDLGDWVKRRTGTYSGGMRRRLELACALLHNPKIFILDEPSVGLDPESRHLIWNILKSCVNAGRTVLMSTHQLDETESLADQIAIIDQGKVIDIGSPSQLKEKVGSEKLIVRTKEFCTPEEAKLASAIVNEINGVEQIIINPCQGYALTVILNEEGKTPEIINSIHDAGLPLFSYSNSKISLDDVYLQSTGRTLIDAELATVGTRDLRKERKQSMR